MTNEDFKTISNAFENDELPMELNIDMPMFIMELYSRFKEYGNLSAEEFVNIFKGDSLSKIKDIIEAAIASNLEIKSLIES